MDTPISQNTDTLRDLELKIQALNMAWTRTKNGLMEREKRHYAVYLLRQKRREYALEARRKVVIRQLAELRRRIAALAAADL